VPQQAIKNCGAAFQRFFKKQGCYPKFKKMGVRDSARLDNGPGTFEFDGRWFPSSKICSACGRVLEELPLSIREWTCACGTFHDRVLTRRGISAAMLSKGRVAPESTHVEEGSGAGLTASVKPASLKQESAMSHLGMD
jgi:hypothetical protein